MRYVQPLREGGSLPAVVDTDGGGLYVVKFRGAGQGAKVLVAELVVGLLAQALDFPVPELAVVDVPARFGRSEPDPEIQDLLKASHGVNVGLRYLDGAFNFDALAALPDALLTDPVGGASFASADAARDRYREYLATRLSAPRPFLDEAVAARERLRQQPPRPLSARR